MKTMTFALICAAIFSLSACTDEPAGPVCSSPAKTTKAGSGKATDKGILGHIVVRQWTLLHELRGGCVRKGNRFVRQRIKVPVLQVKHNGQDFRWPILAWDSYVFDKVAFQGFFEHLRKNPKAPLFLRLCEAPGSLQISVNKIIDVSGPHGQSQACTLDLGKFVPGPAICGVGPGHDPKKVMAEATRDGWAAVTQRLQDIAKQTTR